MSDADVSEPDSIETTTVNFLIEAMCDGDENRAACALRELANLDGFALTPDVLATFFDGPRKSKVQMLHHILRSSSWMGVVFRRRTISSGAV
jgi:hypothetical protein